MFPNPLDEMNRMASQGCAMMLGLVAIGLIFVWLFLKVWPFLVLGLLVYIGYKLTRWYFRPRGERGRK